MYQFVFFDDLQWCFLGAAFHLHIVSHVDPVRGRSALFVAAAQLDQPPTHRNFKMVFIQN
jgi:hypothetical protein